MKIAFIITDLRAAGAQVMLLKLLERLDRRRFSPQVISLVKPDAIGTRIMALGVPVEALDMQPGRFNPYMLFRLVSRLRALKPDVVQTWMYHADLLGGVAAKLAGVRHIVWGLRNSTLDPVGTKLATRISVRLCALLSEGIPQHILCCADTVRRVHAAIGYPDDRMSVIPNGFDLERFKPDPQARDAIRTELGIAPDAPLVGLVGRLDPQKNHTGFIEAAGKLIKRMPQVHFVLSGQGLGTDNAVLMDMVRASGVESAMQLLGQRDDMPRLMAALDVLVSASAYGEGFPNVLGEAMACAVPCVATDVGDSSLIIGDTGKVVMSGNSTDLAQAMEQILALPAAERAALGERARMRIAEHYEIGDIVRRYEAFYAGLRG